MAGRVTPLVTTICTRRQELPSRLAGAEEDGVDVDAQAPSSTARSAAMPGSQCVRFMEKLLRKRLARGIQRLAQQACPGGEGLQRVLRSALFARHLEIAHVAPAIPV